MSWEALYELYRAPLIHFIFKINFFCVKIFSVCMIYPVQKLIVRDFYMNTQLAIFRLCSSKKDFMFSGAKCVLYRNSYSIRGSKLVAFYTKCST